MGTKERREREREELRTRILDTAREMFVAEGYEAVTMRRIAEKIEYSPTAIYFHFRDKEALIKELCELDFYALAQNFLKIAKIDDPIEKLRRTGRAYVEFGLHNPNHYRLMFMTPHPEIEPEKSSSHKGNPEEDAYAFLKSIISEAIAEKLFKPQYDDIEMIAETVWAAVHGVISLEIAKGDDAWVEWHPVKKRTEMMLDLMVDGLTSGVRASSTAAAGRPHPAASRHEASAARRPSTASGTLRKKRK